MKELKLSFCLLQICRLQDIIEEVDRKTGEAKVVWFTAVLLFFFIVLSFRVRKFFLPVCLQFFNQDVFVLQCQDVLSRIVFLDDRQVIFSCVFRKL